MSEYYSVKTVKLRGITFKTRELDAMTFGRIKDKYTVWQGVEARFDEENAYYEWMSQWIKEWNFKDEKGKIYEVKAENVKLLPRSVLERLKLEFNLVHGPEGLDDFVKKVQKDFTMAEAG